MAKKTDKKRPSGANLAPEKPDRRSETDATRRPKKQCPVVKPASAKAPTLPEPRILSRKCLGTDDPSALERLRRQFEADALRWKEGPRGKDDLVAAFGYWIGYPMFLEMIGHEWGENPARTSAYYALNLVHHRATHVLMEEAEKHGLDPHPLYECARVVQKIYAGEPWKYSAGPHDTWPECMGEARYALPAGQQEALRAGEAVFVRLAVKAGVGNKRDFAEAARKVLPPGESRCVPMSLAELCRRYMNDQDARSDHVKPLLEEHSLRRETRGRHKWTLRLDGLDDKARERLTRPTFP
jgi:hypothetical protein